MKRFLVLMALAAAGVACGQTVAEPENHAISVDRLIRYHDSAEYDSQIRQVVNSAEDYLRQRVRSAPRDEKLAAVFDIDETSLSNWISMAGCGFCSYAAELKLYPDATATAIAPTLELFNLAKSLHVSVFFVTGRQERQRAATVKNLTDAGYTGWVELIMQPNGTTEHAQVFKPRDRQAIESKGYRIVLNIGDQASDLAGCCEERAFKLPNPFYLVQ